MANDDDHNDWQPSGPPQGSSRQQQGGHDGSPGGDRLPPEGQGWESLDPDPVLDRPVQDDQAWGAPPQGPSPQGNFPPQGGPPPGHNNPHQHYQNPQQYQGGPQHGGYPGQNQQMMRPPNTMPSQSGANNEEVIAAIISVFVPGAGHLMLGQTQKGFVFLAGILLCGLSYVVSVIIALDAYMVGQAKRHRPVDEWEFFPK